MLLAIDPGADTGWAVYDNGKLVRCGLGRADGVHFDEVRIECPKLRPKGEKNPNSILLVARDAGEHGGFYSHIASKVTYVTPNEWKGSTPKEISHARIWARLDEWEKAVVDASFRAAKGRAGLAPGKRHNVLDAIGIGLNAIGRMGVGA